MKRKNLLLFFAMLLSLVGCQQTTTKQCQLSIEDCDGVEIKDNHQIIEYGSDATFHFTLLDGYSLLGCDYQNGYTLSSTGLTYSLTLLDVHYSMMISLDVESSTTYFTYYANGGERIDGKDNEEGIRRYYKETHLRINTAIGTDLFKKEGYTFLGWNTREDGEGTFIPSGSRYEDISSTCFYAMWSKWSPLSDFELEETSDHKNMLIKKYHGNDAMVSIPSTYQGKRIISIEKGAFESKSLTTLILPSSLNSIESEAFRNCDITTIYLYDNIATITDSSFTDCDKITTLYINAMEKPVYSINYFATFQDKYDRLLSLKDKKKIVLWSGSSTRFGYDSEKIDLAFPSYDVVNMGVFAYSVTTPEFKLILDCMKKDDILLHSPEFDANERQFAYSVKLDAPFWAMMEANYEVVSHLDMKEYTHVFNSFYAYLNDKSDMEKKEYYLSPCDYDEDGNEVSTPSYNKYGDYIVYRPNSESVLPIYGLEVPYTVGGQSPFIPSLNKQYQKFLDKDIHVYYTFSPRNKYAISKESTLEARNELEQYMKDNIIVPIITSLESSLWEGTYLYGTDNHLSTEGVAIRTKQVIQALDEQMEIENITK